MKRFTHFILPIALLALLGSWLLPTFVARSEDRATQRCLDTLPGIETGHVGLFVEPDDSYAPVVDEIDAAQCDINLSIYLLSDQVVMDALVAADRRGVRVRVQLEEDPFGGGFSSTEDATAWLDANEIEWRYTPDRFVFSHAKYFVIDGQVAIIMNQNLTSSAFNGNREFGIVTTEAALVSETLDVFESDWNDAISPENADRIVTSPETSRIAMMRQIASATTSIDMYAEVIRDELFVSALIDAERRGVEVRLIVNQTSDPIDGDINRTLQLGGVEIRYGGNLYIHSKAMTFDDRTVFIGSQNPTANSFDNNRELGVMTDDPIVLVRMRSTYAMDWTIAEAVPPKG